MHAVFVYRDNFELQFASTSQKSRIPGVWTSPYMWKNDGGKGLPVESLPLING